MSTYRLSRLRQGHAFRFVEVPSVEVQIIESRGHDLTAPENPCFDLNRTFLVVERFMFAGRDGFMQWRIAYVPFEAGIDAFEERLADRFYTLDVTELRDGTCTSAITTKLVGVMKLQARTWSKRW